MWYSLVPTVSDVIVSKGQNITNQPGLIMAALSAKPLESKIAPSLLACDLSDMAGEAARVIGRCGKSSLLSMASMLAILRLTG